MVIAPHMAYRPRFPRSGSGVKTLSGEEAVNALTHFLQRHPRAVVLTGAGCSAESGIPDYRDESGSWKGASPVLYQTFVESEPVRRRYWARSLVGWSRVSAAVPNAAHYGLARLEASGRLRGVITQNVDALHRRAGSRRVIELHGRLDRVQCLDCRSQFPRADFQSELFQINPHWRGLHARAAPDGDARLEEMDFSGFSVPPCAHCGGVLKPGVVFFGESVPRGRVDRALAWLDEADALLVVGSSLMVWSGYRFVRAAAQRSLPVAAITLGLTRGDDLLTLKVEDRCAGVLAALSRRVP